MAVLNEYFIDGRFSIEDFRGALEEVPLNLRSGNDSLTLEVSEETYFNYTQLMAKRMGATSDAFLRNPIGLTYMGISIRINPGVDSSTIMVTDDKEYDER